MSELEVFEVQCAECESDFQIDSSQAGTTVHCPNCESPAEIPTLAEIMGEVDDSEQAVDADEPATPVAAAPASQKKPSRAPKKRKPPADSPQSRGSRSPRDGGVLVKAISARRSAQLLIKLSDICYYLACFILVAWSIKVVGMLYPIVNSKRGSYGEWFVETMDATAWGVTYIALLIGAAEVFKVVVYVYENTLTED